MNKKRQKISNEYRELQTKIFTRTILMMVLAVIITIGFYVLFLQGHIANFVVRLLSYFTYKDFSAALEIYNRIVRNNMEIILILAIVTVFLLVLRIYLMGFTKYFNEINRGIDSLIEENSQELTLSPELAATEKKINYIRYTLEQRKLETELAEKRKNDLVMYLAHDLKTPLSSVIGYLTLLRDERQISHELRERYLSISLDKAERLEDLINEFFEITRFSLSNVVLEYGWINLSRMFEQMLYEFKPILEEKNLKWEIEIQEDIMLYCDAGKMQRVFDNLFRNAVNYSYEDKIIKLVVEENEDIVRISVTNQGNTIPQEKLERIFEQFFRLDTARSSSSGGAGLGLAISKEIVELHKGKIIAKSREGFTTFKITLPLS